MTSDKELIDIIATIWVAHGGDALGFDLSSNKIRSLTPPTNEERRLGHSIKP